MSVKFIANVIALLGWFMASLVAFVLVALVGFLAIGFIGLLVCFICVRIELEADSAVGGGYAASLTSTQYQAREAMRPEERAAHRHELSVAMQSVRFFKHLGLGLAVVGLGGFAYYQL